MSYTVYYPFPKPCLFRKKGDNYVFETTRRGRLPWRLVDVRACGDGLASGVFLAESLIKITGLFPYWRIKIDEITLVKKQKGKKYTKKMREMSNLGMVHAELDDPSFWGRFGDKCVVTTPKERKMRLPIESVGGFDCNEECYATGIYIPKWLAVQEGLQFKSVLTHRKRIIHH